MLLRLPIGISHVCDLREQRAQNIDKSHLIIIDILDQLTKVMLVPRPRRFGKTLNLSMLRYFLLELALTTTNDALMSFMQFGKLALAREASLR